MKMLLDEERAALFIVWSLGAACAQLRKGFDQLARTKQIQAGGEAGGAAGPVGASLKEAELPNIQ